MICPTHQREMRGNKCDICENFTIHENKIFAACEELGKQTIFFSNIAPPEEFPKMKTEDIHRAIKMVRHTQLIKDPFPEETVRERIVLEKTLFFRRFFGFPRKNPLPKVSIWAAYQMGYDTAYEEMKRDLPKFLRSEGHA